MATEGGGEDAAADRLVDSKDQQQQSKALDKLTDRVEDRQLDSTRVHEAMLSLASSREADLNAMRLREKELAAVKINASDVDIIANELELEKKVAERTLREHKGDAVAAQARGPASCSKPTRQPTGRFTNGRTIPDIIGQQMGIPTFAPPYLDSTTTGAAILDGVNYASGSAGILNKSGAIFGGRINMDAQLDNYANTRQEIISILGMPAAVSRLRSAIFSITIGSNDFIDNYLTPVLSIPERLTTTPNMFVKEMITKYKQQLVRLYSLDARKIIVINVGPIGCIPFSRDTALFSGTSCVEVPNQLARNFNNKLKDLVMELGSSLDGAHFAYGNAYGIASDILENYKSYGFEVANTACCCLAGRYGGLIPCGPASRVCPDRSKYFFWDAYHPSEAANVIIANRLLDGDSNDIFPVNVRQLAQT